jgi:hypothetical protein
MTSDAGSLPTTLNSFARGVTEQLAFYVYLLIDPRDGSTFYIGKGPGTAVSLT